MVMNDGDDMMMMMMMMMVLCNSDLSNLSCHLNNVQCTEANLAATDWRQSLKNENWIGACRQNNFKIR